MKNTSLRQALIPLSLLLLTAGCYPQKALKSEPAQNNDSYQVQYLFEHDGCKVYRFWDRGHYVYFTNCNGQTISKADSNTVTNSIHVTRPGDPH